MTDHSYRSQSDDFTSFDRKVALSFGVLVFTLLLIVIIISAYNYRRVMDRDKDEMIMTLTEVLNDSINRTSFSGKYHSRLFVEEITSSQPKIVYCAVLDLNNKVLAHSDPTLNDITLTTDSNRRASGVLSGESRVIQDLVLNGRAIREVSMPFRAGYGKELAGYIRVGISTQETIDSIHGFWLHLGILTILLMIGAVFFIYFISRHFGAPVRLMALQLRGILNHSPLLMAIYDSNGRIIECSESFKMQISDAQTEVFGKIDSPLIPECIRLFLSRNSADLPEQTTVIDDEINFVKDKRRITLAVLRFPVFKHADGSQLMCFMAQDISDRIQTKEELKRERAMLRSLIDSIPDLIFFKNFDSVYLGCNRAFEEFVGKGEKEIIGSDDTLLFPKTLADFFRQMDRNMLDSRSARRNEEWVVYPDGKRVLLDTLKTPFVSQTGEHLGLVGISRDITRIKMVEEELAREREKLLVTLASIGDGVISIDVNGNVVIVNRVAELLTGWSQFDASGRSVDEIFILSDPETGAPLENPFRKVLKSGEILALPPRAQLTSRHGVTKHIADSVAPIRDSQGSIMGVVIVFRDVSEKLIMEEEFLKIRKLESLGVLAGGIAHDFNNILTAILGNLDVALQSLDDRSDLHPVISDALKASKRAKNLTWQLLTFSKGGDPIKKVVSIDALIRESAVFVLHGTSITTEFQIPDDLWLVDIDAGQIGQVIQNLVLNAREAIDETGKIEIICKNVSEDIIQPFPGAKKGRWIEINISDNGRGIESEILDRIFDPYFTSKEGGTGLGLAITHSIVKKHGGHIMVQSALNEGTSFIIHLPTPYETVRHVPIEEKIKKVRKGTILVMDDETLVRQVASRMLEHLGFTVLLSECGEQAVEIYRSCYEKGDKVDAVIVDLTVPGGMGGLEAARIIREFDGNAVIAVASGFSEEIMEAGQFEYLSKPFSISALSNLLQQLLPEAHGISKPNIEQ
ncbi:MAG: hypothetical protein CVV64_14605 [Candidatus Wallbacteria bacterium HGW-Wallbacteria-1]|jgi:PAS domain S-box-containing protein|uniref:histidine kinase n=1 Tax=Candidatus Wallbacteria bacterium HGW-Wallbacteria-1 TaxID=2013854 RepID=A0A2N1PM06_9BACT|nr:MAG: hypothetical protein CVV64_14605 [Candidatus Wallbacteria bacterium HGW-Wallbacteria-1]